MNQTYATKMKLAEVLRPYKNEYLRRFNPANLNQMGSRGINRTPCPHCSRYLRGNDCRACPLEKMFGTGEGLSGTPGCKRVMQQLHGPLKFIDHQKGIIGKPAEPQIHAIYQDLLTHL